MTEEVQISARTLAKYKEVIDFIYEATAKDGGYKGALCNYGTRAGYVAAEMVRRGVLKKSGPKMHPVYEWYSGAMAPTKNFYSSIAKACVLKERATSNRARAKIKAQKEADSAKTDAVKVDVNDSPKPIVNTDKDTGLWIVEYNENQQCFHIEGVYERPDGNRYTQHGLYSDGWWPIAIVPDKSIDKDTFASVIEFTDTRINKGLSLDKVREDAFKTFSNRFIYFRTRGLFLGEETAIPAQPEENDDVIIEPISENSTPSLEMFSDRELWDELKRRGCYIDGNKLAKKVITYLD